MCPSELSPLPSGVAASVSFSEKGWRDRDGAPKWMYSVSQWIRTHAGPVLLSWLDEFASVISVDVSQRMSQRRFPEIQFYDKAM